MITDGHCIVVVLTEFSGMSTSWINSPMPSDVSKLCHHRRQAIVIYTYVGLLVMGRTGKCSKIRI